MDKLIMEFMITIRPEEISTLEKKNGAVVFIPFGGSVESKLFSGTIQPGAADIQTVDAAGVRHMCAKYLFVGKDYTGAECRLFVENNGYFERDAMQKPVFHACPTFMTDSEALAPYLELPIFRAEGHAREGGVCIKIFDVKGETA